jgi:hypothetical protein
MSSDSDASSDSDSDFLDCPLEQMLDPTFSGEVTKESVVALLSPMSASELSRTSELCTCGAKRGCKYRKYVDCDELWWPRCAAAWYEPGNEPPCPGKAPKDKKTWKAAYLALKPEDGPSVEDMARRAAKIAKREALLEKWKNEAKAASGHMSGTAVGVGDVSAPVDLSNKAAMREFYKSVRSKPKGKSARGSYVPVFIDGGEDNGG